MTITLELSPDTEVALREIAARHGLEPNEYVKAVIEAQIQVIQATGKRSLLSFQGVAPWDGTDAQERVNQLRAEWDEQREQALHSPQNTPVATR